MAGPADLPPSRFRGQLEGLPVSARGKAVAWLRRFHFTEHDLASLHADAEGGVFYADHFEPPPAAEALPEPGISTISVPVSPFPASLVFHSCPGAPNVLFLNFSGENVTGTAWNSTLGRTPIPAVAFSTDADLTTFSDSEQAAIKSIWQRVAEDYAPFNVDVTTERPATFTTRTGHALITRHTDANGQDNPAAPAGGVAYISVFASSSYANYRPAWIYHDNLANNESYTAEAVSHELGHNLGLSHDGGTNDVEYYSGHGSGDISWGPLMGTGYNRNVSQWSKGEYYLANNTQDDLAVMASLLAYRTDDHSNTLASATALSVLNGTNIWSSTPEIDPANTNRTNKGVLERNTDVDVFSFVTGNGAVDLSVNPWKQPSGTRGGNADVLVELYNSTGALLLTNNGATVTYARLQTNLTEGQYYLAVRNSGAGTPLSSSPSGYTTYGSLGQYFISGTVVRSSFVIPPRAELAVANVSSPGSGAVDLAVTYSDNAAINAASIDGHDLRVTGPGGYDRLARFVSKSTSVNSSSVTAHYAADPPNGGIWVAADNGVYTVWMRPNEVTDVEGAVVADGQLGQFTVTVPVALYLADMNTDPGWELEPKWQYGSPAYTSGGPTAGATGQNIIAYNLSGVYESTLSTKYAMTPPINCSGADNLSLRFQRWLGLAKFDTATIQVATNGSAWTTIWSTSKAVTDTGWLEVQYALPAWTAGSPSLRVRWGLAAAPPQQAIGWNLDDVQILAGGNLDTVAPTATLSVSALTMAGTLNHPFTVTYADNTAVRVSTLSASNFVASGPNNYSNLVNFVGVDLPGDSSPRTGSYSVPPPNGTAWSAADNGTYQLLLQAEQVTDIYNNPIPETVLGSFEVNISTNNQRLVVNTALLTVPEGGQAAFTIRLAEPPAIPISVSITRASGDSDLALASSSTLLFDARNWLSPATVTIAAALDGDADNGTAVFACSAESVPPVQVLAEELDTTTPLTIGIAHGDPASGAIVLTWAPSPGQLYSIEWSTNLNQGFSILPCASNLPPEIHAVTNTTGVGDAFYRLKVEKP